ncbi:MAG: hypothetical protein V1755_07395 [Chloroflexota bacterium]
MKRKRGAPLGNKNAYKHGFYSPHFRQRELENVDAHAVPELADEIHLVRVATSRFLASLEADTRPRDVETELSILRAISLGALSINGLVRTRLMLARGDPATLEMLSQLMASGSKASDQAAARAQDDQPV